jgi:tRNA pseudouridine38-40 synthase
VTPVADDFHARFSARQRRYRYLLHRSPVRHPLLAGRAGWTFRAVDVARLRRASRTLQGEHDFSAFRSSQCQAASPVRRLEAIEVTERGPFILLTFAGNAFLHHMIRNIVGTLLMAGDGRRPVDWVAEVLESRDRRRAAPTFEAAGLYLDGVLYGQDCTVPSWPVPEDSPLVMAFG